MFHGGGRESLSANGASFAGDGGEDDDADLLPLSSVFTIRRLRRGYSWECSPGKEAPVPASGGSRVFPQDEGGDGASASGRRRRFENGDLVWAKAFPYTWWPGWVRDSRDTACLVSFFGGDKPRLLEESGIRGFEENYLRMSKMAGARLAGEVDCALAELGRRTALGMACSCRGVADAHPITQTARERKRFEPAEMLAFVRGLAVHAWVDVGQTICAVRVAAQVNAYRSHAWMGSRAEVNRGFQPEEMLDAIRSLAVSAWVHDAAAVGMARVVAQLDVYRRFVFICPDWAYQGLAEEDGSSTSCSTSEDSEGSNVEMSFISLSETEEAEDSYSFYENDIEEQDKKDSTMQEVVQPGSEFCTINRIDYTIFSSDTESEYLSDSEMENAHNWNTEKGVAFDAESTCDVSTFNNDHHNWICNLICGLISSDSGQELSLGRESEKDQGNEFNVADAVSRDVELLSNVNIDMSSVSIDCTDVSTTTSSTSCGSASCLDRFQGKEFDENVPVDSSVEMHKAADFSLTDGSKSRSIELTAENSSQLFVDFSLKCQPGMMVGMLNIEEGGLLVLHEMLYYLYRLASNPHMRTESLPSFCQLVLSYRASTFLNVSSFPSTICTDETKKTQELYGWGHHHLTNERGEEHQDDKVTDMCEHSSVAEVLLHAHDKIIAQSSAQSHSKLHIPHATGDDSITVHSSAITASETVDKKYNDGIKFQFNAKRRISGKIVVDKRYDAASKVVIKGVSRLTSPASGDLKVATWRSRFDQEVASAPSSDLHVANRLASDVKASTVSMMLLETKRSNDKKVFCMKQRDINSEMEILFQGNAGYDAMAVQSSSSFSAAGNTSGNHIEHQAVARNSAFPLPYRYEASSCRKRRLSQPVHSYISEWQKSSLFNSATRLYASPLVRDSSSATDRAQCSPTNGRRIGPSNSLHMKFPRGFNLPSKEDLEKIFSVFGPLDHSRTRVFFYTGAGKVVFLNSVDAESAYNYVRRNRVFETNMRFWLDAHENLRNNYSKTSSEGQMSTLSLKSCLKTSSSHENEDVKKKCRVRFSI